MNNWDNVRYFLAVAKAGTVKAAADSMGVSHTTVLRRIDLFEQEIEAKLFKRLQSGYELTSFGQSILDKAIQVRNHIELLELDIKGQGSKLEGCLRISQPENEIIDLYPIYAEFNRLYPQITLQIVSSLKLSNLKRHQVDMVIRFTESPDELLVGRCVGSLDFGLYGSKSYFAKFKKKPKLDELDWVIFKIFSQKIKRAIEPDDWIAKRVKNPKVILQTPSSSGVINAVRAGMGVGFISTLAAKEYDDLVMKPLNEPAFSLKLWLLTHNDLRHNAMVKAFMRHFSDSLAKRLS